jgi:hypothetical protein
VERSGFESDLVLGFVSYWHFGFYTGVVYVPVTFLTIDIFDFSFPFVLSRFALETLLRVLSSFSLPHFGDVGHIEVVCVHVLVICYGVCVSFSCSVDCGWLDVCSVRVLEGDVSLVCVLDRGVRKIVGGSLDLSVVHFVHDVFFLA